MPRPLIAPLLLALLHLVLALVYASETPYRQDGVVRTQGRAYAKDIGAPDERQHANYVARLASGQGLPVFDPKDPNLYENYQGHQPPLYYGVAAAWSKVVGADPTQAESGVRMRALNSVIGATTVLAVYFLAIWGLGSASVGLGAATFVALLPMNCALSGAVSNDPLLISLCTWCLAFAAKGVAHGWDRKTALACGLLAGLAILTKTNGVSLLPVLLVAAFMRKPKPVEFAMVLVPLLLLILPWWVRNQSLYGDPLAIQAFGQAFTGSKQAKDFIDSIGGTAYWMEWVGWWTARSYIGVFGYMDIWLTNTGMPNGANGIYQLSLLMILGGVFLWLVTLQKATADERKVHALNFGFGLIVLLLFVRFNSQYFQAQARYLYPALGPVAVAVATGYHYLLRQRPKMPYAILAAPLLLANLFALSRLPTEFAARMQAPPSSNTP